MGTWGLGVFDNDAACDWAYDLAESDDLSVIETALDGVLASGANYLDADFAEEGLAAAAVVACLQGNMVASNACTEPVLEWVRSHPLPVSEVLAGKAARVVERVLTDPCELLDLWAETEELGAGVAGVKGVGKRVMGI